MHSVSFLRVSVVPANTSGEANSYLQTMIIIVMFINIIIIILVIMEHVLKIMIITLFIHLYYGSHLKAGAKITTYITFFPNMIISIKTTLWQESEHAG